MTNQFGCVSEPIFSDFGLLYYTNNLAIGCCSELERFSTELASAHTSHQALAAYNPDKRWLHTINLTREKTSRGRKQNHIRSVYFIYLHLIKKELNAKYNKNMTQIVLFLETFFPFRLSFIYSFRLKNFLYLCGTLFFV